MTASATEKMDTRDGENRTSGDAAAETRQDAKFSDELEAAQWAVMSFDEIAVRGLPYAEAVGWLDKLRRQKVDGLCIVTDEAANRFAREK